MSYPSAQNPSGTGQSGESEPGVAPVVDLRTGRPVVPAPRPAEPAEAAVSGEVLPAADSPWERVRQAAERPVLPAWLTDRAVAGHRARWLARAAMRQAARGAMKSPVVAARVSVMAGRGAAAGVRVWWRWVRAEALYAEARDLRADASKPVWEAAYERARKAREVRAWVTLAGLPLLAAGVWVSGLVWGPLVWWGTGAVAALVAGAAGRRPGERILPAGSEAPARPVELGMPAGQLHATIEEVMAGLRLDVTVLRSQAHPWGWDVQIMAGQALSKVSDKLEEIEARLRTRQGAVTLIADRQDAGLGVLRIVWKDPFASMPAPPRRAPRSLSVRGLHSIGRTLDGGELRLPLTTHTGIVGKSGSGKSSALWTILDLLTAANDAVVVGIDLTGAAALNIWGDLITHYATTKTAAEGLLKAVLAWGHARASVVGRALRPTADSDPTGAISENWQITPQAPAVFLVIDEFPVLAAAGLTDLVKEILQTARKASIFVYIASQRAVKDELGDTTIRTALLSRIGLACDPDDVRVLFGNGAAAAGWRPDRLVPSAGEGRPNDAGRCYVKADGHTEPRVNAVYRLDAPEVKARAVERLRHAREHGQPTIDRATWEAADAYARRQWDMGLDDLLRLGESTLVGETAAAGVVQEPTEVPRILTDLRAVLVDADADAMHTDAILSALADRSDRYAGWTELALPVAAGKLAAAVKRYGLRADKLRNVAGREHGNGYRLSDIQDAIKRHVEG
jgi:hypothetical protein